MPRNRVIVVGLGAMGSSAAMHLARRGRGGGTAVTGIEQFEIGHDRGSSLGATRLIRMCYYEHPDYVPLLKRAYELWRGLEHDSGERLLFVSGRGGIFLGPPAPIGEVVAGSARAAALHHLDHELLDRRALAERCPQFTVQDDYVGLFEPTAGYLLPERVILVQARLAAEAGAALHEQEAMLDWTSDGETVRVRTTKGVHEGERLVICGGAWASKLVRDLGVEVTPSRQVLGWVSPREPGLFGADQFGVWALEVPSDREDGCRAGLYYGFPLGAGGVPGLKVARHARGTDIDPDREPREWRAEDDGDYRPALRAFLPTADGPLVEGRVCMYENSPDGHFIIDRHPVHPNVVVACGFSGHGFKFASVVGEVLADLALEGRTRHPIGFLGLERFG